MFAGVVIDINHKDVDRVFTYRVPEELLPVISVGKLVRVPFGKSNRIRKGYVFSLSETTDLDPALIKDMESIPERASSVEEELISLAVWMRDRFGGTLYQCISSVLPSKIDLQEKTVRYLVAASSKEEMKQALHEAERKKYYARCRLLEALLETPRLPSSIVMDRLNVSRQTIRPLLEAGLIREETLAVSEGQKGGEKGAGKPGKVLNDEQTAAVEKLTSDPRPVQILFGVTGSGKTEVYMELIEKTLASGKEAIVLIPEIALTYQTVMRFYDRFGDTVSFVHSRLTPNEKAERFKKASQGLVRVMIGPRSALFTPFSRLGLIVIDEFHEQSYRSDQVPKYDAVETAIHRAKVSGARVILGSASPSVELYHRAMTGEFGLVRMKNRAVKNSRLPETTIVDLREELKAKNRSILSRLLQEKIRDRLERHEQIMLFLNRRGYSGAVSCRSCGEAITCVHCSTSLTQHRNGRLKCHICGYERGPVKVCPKCGSKLIGSFGIGTQRVEEIVQETFHGIRTLRMDADTTSTKNGHQVILEQFSRAEADVLIGTQMIVKGHDFPNVTLVGILAADLSLYVPDHRSAERTFQLLLQAEGRAGRSEKAGECIVQTYNPDHYAIVAAKEQDFERFYQEEIDFRKALAYPPVVVMTRVRIFGRDEKRVRDVSEETVGSLALFFASERVVILGPAEENVSVVKDMYRYGFTYKCQDRASSLRVKSKIEQTFERIARDEKIYLSFEE